MAEQCKEPEDEYTRERRDNEFNHTYLSLLTDLRLEGDFG